MKTLAPSFLNQSSSFLQVRNMHKSLDEFKFRPDTDTNTRVICPCASEKLLYNVQNQNSLLVKRQNDNTSPGDWPRKISP